MENRWIPGLLNCICKAEFDSEFKGRIINFYYRAEMHCFLRGGSFLLHLLIWNERPFIFKDFQRETHPDLPSCSELRESRLSPPLKSCCAGPEEALMLRKKE